MVREKKKMRKKKEERREAEERERERKKRENICLMREKREVNKILLFFLASCYSAQP